MAKRDTQLDVFPLFLKVEDKRAVVVGDGDEALAKARLLSNCTIAIRLVSAKPSSQLAAFAIQHDAELIVGGFDAAHLQGAAVVFAATGNAELDAAVIAAARAEKIPANAVDRPELCDFFTPALVNRAPVAIAIGSQGAGPVLTQIIRSRIEALLPPSTGVLARLAASYRVAAEKLLPRGTARREFWRSFFEGPVAALTESGRLSEARREATRLLRRQGSASGIITFVGAGPGAADLLTLRAQRLMQQADIIVHDTGLTDEIVSLGRRDAIRAVADDLQVTSSLVMEHFRAGHRVVRLVAGDPSSHSGVTQELGLLADAGIRSDIVPGVSAGPARKQSSHLAA